MSLSRHPGRSHPFSLLRLVTRFLKNLLQGTYVCGRNQEKMNRFIQGLSGVFWSLS